MASAPPPPRSHRTPSISTVARHCALGVLGFRRRPSARRSFSRAHRRSPRHLPGGEADSSRFLDRRRRKRVGFREERPEEAPRHRNSSPPAPTEEFNSQNFSDRVLRLEIVAGGRMGHEFAGGSLAGSKRRRNEEGYFKNVQVTQSAVTPNGWLKTDDLRYIDEDGYLFVVYLCEDGYLFVVNITEWSTLLFYPDRPGL